MDTLAAASCDNGACAIGCLVGCIVTGGADVAFGALGGVIGSWLVGPAEIAA